MLFNIIFFLLQITNGGVIDNKNSNENNVITPQEPDSYTTWVIEISPIAKTIITTVIIGLIMFFIIKFTLKNEDKTQHKKN